MKYIILIIILLLLIILKKNIKEKFSDIVSNIVYPNFEADYKSDNDTNKSYDLPNINCCLVEKKYLPSEKSINGGNFKYTFEKLENQKCNNNIYNLNSNKQLFIEGENNWSNENCIDNNIKIGSCRNINKECIDFVDNEFCNKYRMVWSDRTCQNAIPYVWIDKMPKLEPTSKPNLIKFSAL